SRTYSVMAAATRRTLANVKSSPITARQPSVPNLILSIDRPAKTGYRLAAERSGHVILGRVVFPERAVVVHQANRLAACRNLGKRVAVVAHAAEQSEELAPRISLLPLRETGGAAGSLTASARSAPGRRRPPQVRNLA